jgi:hypothetical protein
VNLSVFSVISGDKCLGFFWKGDQLFTKKATLSAEQEEQKWTSFLMKLREAMPTPSLSDFSRFLATCLLFTEHLRSIQVLMQDKLVIDLSKTASSDIPLEIPNFIRRYSPDRIFTLESTALRNVQMTGKILQEVQQDEEGISGKIALFFGFTKPKPPKPKEYKWVSCSTFLRVAIGTLNVSAGAPMQQQMERTTKKRIPGTCKAFLVYNTVEEYSLSQELMVESLVFKDLVPFPNQGNVFIGFRTHQTTGCSVHLAGHFIPVRKLLNLSSY